MKSIIFTQHGKPDVLQLTEMLDPVPTGSDVVVNLKMAAVNHVDIWVRQGGPAYPVSLPHVPGADGAGIIDAVGPDAEGVSVGDRVLIAPGLSCGTCPYCLKGQDNQCDTFEILGAKRRGTYSEKVVVPDQNVIPIPHTLSFEDAAAFPLAYLTAWHMLERAQLKAKEKILIVGGSAGIALAAIQIAKLKGATVYATTTNIYKKVRIEKAGADEVFATGDGRTPGKVDVVFEHVGPATWASSVASLKKYGRLVTCGATTGPTVELELRSMFSRDISILGARMGTQKEFQSLCAAIFSEQIKPVVDCLFPLADAASAHAYIEEKKQVGKVLLRI